MSNLLTVPKPSTQTNPTDDLGIDRAFLLQMAQIPFISAAFVALSFVRQAEDVHTLRRYLDSLGSTAKIISKIEDQAGVRNMREIIQASDAIMVARGDLGIEIDYHRLPLVQTELVAMCQAEGKPVIIATHLLETMISSPMPTRAEISDVSNAIREQADAMAKNGMKEAGYRFINIDDSEQVLRAIRLTDKNVPIDLILHTPGGLVLAAEQIAEALLRHPAKVTVFVPHYAMSGGTLIALAADEIVMDENAVLGPVDPQLGQYPAASILKVLEKKPIQEIDDQTLILADVAEKALKQVKATVKNLLLKRMPEEKAEEVATLLSQGTWTHDYPIDVAQAREMGLPVSTEMPLEVYELMDLYPQAQGGKPSVQYVPVPYRHQQPGRP